MKNKVILIGRLGSDVEMQTFENGNAAGNFSLATNEYYKDKESQERKEITDWHRIVVNGELAKTCEKFIRKGSTVAVEGKIKSRKYTDKEGVERSITEIRADEVTFLDKKENP